MLLLLLLLLSAGGAVAADLDLLYKESLNNDLVKAYREGKVEHVSYLLRCSANPNIQNKNGFSMGTGINGFVIEFGFRIGCGIKESLK